MFFYRMRFEKKQDVLFEPKKQKFFRYCIVLICFFAVVVGFLKTGEEQTALLRKSSRTQIDETGMLAPDHLELVRVYSREFQHRYGLPIYVSIRKTPFLEGFAPPQGAVFIGICPSASQIIITAPAVFSALVGASFLDDAQSAFLEGSFLDGTWPQVLAGVLSQISIKLDIAMRLDAK